MQAQAAAFGQAFAMTVAPPVVTANRWTARLSRGFRNEAIENNDHLATMSTTAAPKHPTTTIQTRQVKVATCLESRSV
jgi:hypothetical protein